jgi:hypothetical protein
MPQTKKHKTWDGDAILCVEGNRLTMYDSEGKQYVLHMVSHLVSVFNCTSTATV